MEEENKPEIKEDIKEIKEKENKTETKEEIKEKENKPKKHISKTKETLTDKMRENPWIISTLVLGVLVLVLLVGNFSGEMVGQTISEEEAGEAILNFVQSRTQGEGELIEINDFDDNFYEAVVAFQGQEIPLYATKDGEYLVSGLTPLVDLDAENTPTQQTPPSQDIQKSDKPVVELFVMTHCPYGTQAEKGMIPVLNALEDTIDGKIRFVHYFMHDPEKTETPLQVCIREEQSSKYLNYLTCFLEEGNSEQCLTKTGINQINLNKCIEEKSTDYYAEDSELSQAYGVQSSPTLVINGKIISSARDPASYLSVICSAFTEAPEECDAELSTATPSAMWGWDATSAGTTASCS